MQKLEESFSYIESSYIPAIARNLYEADERQLKLELKGLLENRDFIYALVTKQVGDEVHTFSGGTNDCSNIMERTYPLIHIRKDRPAINLGIITIHACYEKIYKRVIRYSTTIIISNAIIIFFLAFCIYFITEFLITRHLVNLSKFTKSLSVNEIKDSRKNLRKKINPEEYDEIDTVMYALQNFKEKTDDHIARQKQIEEELMAEKEFTDRALYAQEDTFFVFDLETGQAIRWNKSFEDISGYSSNEILNLKAPQSYYSEEDLVLAGQAIETILKGETATVLIYLVTKDGKRIPFEYRVSVFTTSVGKRQYGVSIGRNVTDRLKAEQALKESLHEKEILLRELYHRTKNNMQVICSMLHLQLDTIHNEDTKKIFIETENKIHAMALVHQMLYKSQDLTNINLNGYIHSLIKLLHSSYHDLLTRVQFDLNLEDINVAIDTAIPCGIFINELISNSIKHAFPNDRSGKITIILSKNNDNMIHMQYSDNGIGIAPGFNFRNQPSLGLQTIINIIEQQLNGHIEFIAGNGIKYNIKFKDSR